MPQLTGHFTPGLHGERLERIIASLSSCDSAVVCLQEVHSDSVLRALEKGLAHKYKILTSHRANIPSRMALEALHILFGLLVAVTLTLVACVLQSCSHWQSGDPGVHWHCEISLISFFIAYWGGRYWVRHSALSNFLRCSNHGGLATLYDPRRFRKASDLHSLVFTEQRGDALNIFKKRGATAVVLEAVEEGSARATTVTVVNCHLNLGIDCLRNSQASEAASLGQRVAGESVTGGSRSSGVVILGDFNAPESDATVTDMGSVHGFTDAFTESGVGPRRTWCASNPLTHGTLREPDACIDYVFYRPLRDGSLLCRGAVRVFADAPFISDHFGIRADLRLEIVLSEYNSGKEPELLVFDSSIPATPGSVSTASGSDASSLPSSGCSVTSDLGECDDSDGPGSEWESN